MQKDIAMRWAGALESGDYKQGKGRLRTPNDEFCCLGVLCNLHAMDHPELAALETDPLTYMGERAVLPELVRDWAGLRTESAALDNQLHGNTLAVINDSGKSFRTIARIIRKEWEKL